MGSTGAGPLVPTFHGFVSNSMDGLILFEACLSGKLHHVPRRPHDRERASLIKSGSIFIYEENASGIKRWTDGVAWSPSRILGNFLIYRELEKPFPPGEKKRAMKRKRQSLPGEPYPRRESDETGMSDQITPITPPTPTLPGEPKSETATSDQDKEMERSLIGSLVDSYGFRPDGLVKKTMSISINGISHHMVSYYKVDDVKNSILPRPMTDPRLQGITVRPDLYLKQNFRAPVEETEGYAIDNNLHAHPQLMYQMPNGAYGGVRPGQYFGGHQYQAMYAMSGSTTSPYTTTSASAWPTQQQTSGQAPYGAQQAYTPQNYAGYYQGATQQIKSEDPSADSKPMSYSSHYPPYGGMQHQRGVSQPTPTMQHSAYQTPVQQSPSTFAPMLSRPSYSNATMPSPTTSGPSQPTYNSSAAQKAYTATSSQQYAVRSPPQNYHMQPAQHNAVPQSPNHLGKNEMSAPPPELAYRNPPYPQSGDRNPLHYY